MVLRFGGEFSSVFEKDVSTEVFEPKFCLYFLYSSYKLSPILDDMCNFSVE